MTTENRKASHADYANADFEAQLTPELVRKFGGEDLADRCIDFRLAAIILSKSKKELLETYYAQTDSEQEATRKMHLHTIERLQDTEKFIAGLAEMNEAAIARLLSMICSIVPEDKPRQAA